MWDEIGEHTKGETRAVKLLGITIDHNFEYDEHLSNLCIKANGKLPALTKVRKYLNIDKTRNLFNAFFKSQFKYCSLTWMFCSRHTNNRIN